MQLDWYAALVERLEFDPVPSWDNDQSTPGIWEEIKDGVNIVLYCPQASPDVLVRELDDRQGVYFVVKNTVVKTYLRLSLEEFNIWSQMDGETTVHDLIVEHYSETGKYEQDKVIRLVDKLYWRSMLTEKPVAVWGQLN